MSSAPKKLKRVGTDPSEGEHYPAIAPTEIAYVEIFPAVGIARLGDSESEYFLAPEVPHRTDPPAGIDRFRDPEQKIRRQAVRFRVYAYNSNNEVLGEINNAVTVAGSESKYALKWTVKIANKKAAYTQSQSRFADPPVTSLRNPHVQPEMDLDERSKLIVEDQQEISSGGTTDYVNLGGKFQGSNDQPPELDNVYLGQIQVDDDGADKAGRLIFIPGDGHSENVKDPNHAQPEILSKYDGSDWIDNSCDGWVKVEVQVPGSDTEPLLSKHHATVISGPPNFSWGINAPTTLFNIMESIYWYRPGQPAEREVDYDFTKDIWPTLISPGLISWTNYEALQGHGPSTNGHFASDNIIAILKGKDGVKRNNLKNRVFEKLRKPDYEDPAQAGIWWMPRMSGDNDDMQEAGTFLGGLTPDIRNYTALTKLQYERFRKWKDDPEPLSPNWTPEPPPNIEHYDKQDQPEQLTLASLESTIGDSLFPGMETDWIAKEPAIYDLSISNLRPPFRINYDPPAESTASPVKPGHLSRGLAIPWQSDFWECSSTWWPSSRPNNVITKAAYENTMGKSGTQSQYDKAVHTRSDWTRGFRATPDMGQTETSDNIPLYSNTDMVRYWHFLGFVRKYQKDYPIGSTSERTFTAWVESERLEL